MEDEQKQNAKSASDKQNQSDIMEEEQKQNPKDDSDLPNQSGNDGGQTSESSDEDENVHGDENNTCFNWRNYGFTSQELELELAFELYDVPSVWRVPIEQLISHLKRKDASSNKKAGPFEEIRFACKILTDYMDNFKEHHKLVAFTMQRMMPFLLEMRYADTKSKNISYDSAGRDKILAEARASADFATEWIRSRKLFYKGISSELRKMLANLKINSLETDMNRSTDKMNNKMTDSETNVITSKLKELTCTLYKTTLDTNETSSGANTETSKGGKTVFKTIEPIDDEHASTSGINKASYKREEMDSKAQARMQSKKANVLQTIIKSIVASSDSVQKFNKIALENAGRMLHDTHEKKILAEKMKFGNLLSKQQSQSFKDDFNLCIKFAHDIKNCIFNIIKNIDTITEYLKLNEEKLLSGKEDVLQNLAYFEYELCEYLLEFHEVAFTCQKAGELLEETSCESITASINRGSIEYESLFYNHLSNFVALSQTFQTAWNASDAYLDILHCLFVLLVDDIEKFWSDLPQGSNPACFNKCNIKSAHGTQINTTNVPHNVAAIVSGKLSTQIPKQIISREKTTPTATTAVKAKGKTRKSKKKKRR